MSVLIFEILLLRVNFLQTNSTNDSSGVPSLYGHWTLQHMGFFWLIGFILSLVII